MIFFVDNNGEIIKSIPTPVNQGSVNANNVYLIAPFAANTAVSVAFKLPNGVWTQRYVMTPVNEITGIVNKETGQTYSGWAYSMPNNITEFYGTVTAQFFFYASQANVIIATSAVNFAVAKGVPAILPETPDEDVYAAILSNISAIQQQINTGQYPARSFVVWNSAYSYGENEIVYYPDVGILGAFVKSKISNNVDHQPYDEQGILNSQYWDLVFDFNALTKAIVVWGFNAAAAISDLEMEVI